MRVPYYGPRRWRNSNVMAGSLTARLHPRSTILVVKHVGHATAVRSLLAEFPDLVGPDALSDPADPWLIAAAARYGAVLVTNEAPSSERRRPGRPRIPDICARRRIECINVVAFVEREGLA